jgi:PAS domain S-box-containing protein
MTYSKQQSYIGFFSMVICIAVLFGWTFRIRPLLSVLESGATMKVNTALGFILLGGALLLLRTKAKILAYALILLAGLIGLFTILQDLIWSHEIIDNLLIFDEYSSTLNGRMSDATSLNFILVSLGFYGISSKRLKFKKAGQATLLVVSISAVIAIATYFLQVPAEDKHPFLNSMAIHTSVLFFILSYGFSLFEPRLGFIGMYLGEYSGSKTLRLLFPFIFGLPILLGYLFLVFYKNGLFLADFGIAVYSVMFILLATFYISIVAKNLNEKDREGQQLQESLKTANNKLREFHRAVNETNIIEITDPKGRIIHVNKLFEKVSQYSKEELVGLKHVHINSGYHNAEFFSEMWKTLYRGTTWKGEIRNQAKDGSNYWVHTSIIPLKDDEGNIYQYYSVQQNITANKEAQELLESEYVKELENKNKELEQFNYITSHDLQEPLTTITSFSDILLSKYENQLDETGKKSLNFIAASAKRMKTLINEILEYGRIGNKSEQELTDLNKMIDNVVSDLQATITTKKASVIIGDMPSVLCHPIEIRLLFQNLIGNAIKYVSEDVQPQVKVSSKQVNDMWQFSIHDNGIGIKPELIPKIFLIFQRLHKSDKFEGTGIGLSHCKKVAEMHGGEIWAESELGKGSIFHFTLKV